MLAHDAQLVGVELARLLQDPVGDRDLAEVVQQAGQPTCSTVSSSNPIARAMPSTSRDTDWLWAPA
jgi:hypothetical protein